MKRNKVIAMIVIGGIISSVTAGLIIRRMRNKRRIKKDDNT